jgi:hypothetical protein
MLKVRLGNQVKYVRAVLQVAFVMGDQKSNDNICCRKVWLTRLAGTSRMYVSSLHADDPTRPVSGLNPNSFMSFPRCVSIRNLTTRQWTT